MTFDQPLNFTPLYKHRIWGGCVMEEKLRRPLPPGTPIGESWELVDRDDDQSVVADGPHAGLTLHDLWTRHRAAVFGNSVSDSPRFPLLAKILDAREKLSVQVHPPAHVAAQMNAARAFAGSSPSCGNPAPAEPKTEMWFVLDAKPDAELFVGFRNGTTRESFEAALKDGTCTDLLHRIPVRQGDYIFIPSGRCHAIGAGCLIIEIQQNSDTTYRVFDWNRVDSAGKPRELHIDESLKSIDFTDHEPSLDNAKGETLVSCEYFRVDRWQITRPRRDAEAVGSIFTVVDGHVRCGEREFLQGDFFLLPASASDREIMPMTTAATLLRSVAV